MQLFSARLNSWVNPAEAFVQIFADQPNSFWLDRVANRAEPFSVIGAGKPIAASGVNDIDELERALSELGQNAVEQNVADSAELPFAWRPGLVGWFEYEGGGQFLSVDRAIVFDHGNQSIYLIGLFKTQEDFADWSAATLLRVGLLAGQSAAYRLAKASHGSVKKVSLRHSATDYLQMILQAQEFIARGDVYQICLTNEISIENDLDPLQVFLELRELNPAPYSAFLKLGDKSVVCSSPEQFLRVSASGRVSTKPIKGTRPRGANPQQDAERAQDLRENLKERAENLMIVDLMRNDIGRVAAPESLSVTKLFDVESYATVHQLVSTIEAQLAYGQSALSAVRAAFPGGSMTGAPKIRAMQIIEQLERGPRGVYSGALGVLGFDGSADFGMTIRTLVFQGGRATLGVGGGITSDSDPVAELEETKLKAAALLRALNAPDPWA